LQRYASRCPNRKNTRIIKGPDVNQRRTKQHGLLLLVGPGDSRCEQRGESRRSNRNFVEGEVGKKHVPGPVRKLKIHQHNGRVKILRRPYRENRDRGGQKFVEGVLKDDFALHLLQSVSAHSAGDSNRRQEKLPFCPVAGALEARRSVQVVGGCGLP